MQVKFSLSLCSLFFIGKYLVIFSYLACVIRYIFIKVCVMIVRSYSVHYKCWKSLGEVARRTFLCPRHLFDSYYCFEFLYSTFHYISVWHMFICSLKENQMIIMTVHWIYCKKKHTHNIRHPFLLSRIIAFELSHFQLKWHYNNVNLRKMTWWTGEQKKEWISECTHVFFIHRLNMQYT